MKKLLCSIFLLLSIVLCAHAGPYYSGSNQMVALLEAIEDHAAGKLDETEFSGSSFNPFEHWPLVNSGFIYKASLESGEPSKESGHPDRVFLEYKNSDNYWTLRAIYWKNAGYVQKPNSIISLLQPADISNENARFAEDNELRWLRFLDFSGNRFHTLEIDGANLLNELEWIDLSNNPTLKHLYVDACPNPNLKVDISKNGFSFGEIFDLVFERGGMLFENDYSISPKLIYGNQGIIYRTFAHNDVDLYYDADGFTQPTTYLFTEADGITPIEPTVLSPGKFSFPSSYDGEKVYCNAKCGYFTQMPEGLTFLISLTNDGPAAIKTIKNQSDVYCNGTELIITCETQTFTDIYSIAGQKVLSSTAASVNLSSLNKGCYIARITNANGMLSTLKFIK